MSCKAKKRGVAIIAPFPPRKGGVTVQASLLSGYLERDGVRVVRVDTNLPGLQRPGLRWFRPLVQPFWILGRLLAERRNYEVAHFLAASYWGFMPAVVGVPLCRVLAKRIVVSYLGGQGPLFIDRFPWLTKPIFRLATVTTVCSTELEEEFQRRGVACELVNNIFESEIFTPGTRNGIKRKLAWTRAFEETYDPMAAIEVFEIVKSRYPDASLLMTGDGSMLARARDYIRERGISDILLPGRISREEVAKAMQQADICINTSKLDGVPTALLEAAGTALPIVTTPVGGIPTVFAHKVSAVMVPVGDPKAMASAVTDLIENPERADRLGEAGREVALGHTWKRLKETWMRVYELGGEED